jgi:serine protease AprX
MRRLTPLLLGAALAGLAVVPTAPAQASGPLAPVSTLLGQQLSTLGIGTLPVFVHASDIAAARQAVADSGLTLLNTWNKVGIAVARGSAAQIQAVRARPGVTYVEADQPITMALATSNVATHGNVARAMTDSQGRSIDGRGVSVAIIDSGVDGTHPFLKDADGTSAVKKNLKDICLTSLLDLPAPVSNDQCFVDVTGILNDTDTLSLGGHGTHVAGIAAGRDVTLTNGEKLHGAAPGATVIGLSVGAAISVYGADNGLNWVLDHHANPCAGCPPIKVTNNSYGPTGGGAFDPSSATVVLQRALAAEGVVTVWAAGNDGPDNTATNPPGQDPTGGIVMVASYDDLGTGTRDGNVSDFSSRGSAGHPETYPDISAPGSNITSSCRLYLPICSTGLDPKNGPGLLDIGTFNTISGTSMATPHMVGIVAQLFQAVPDATPAAVERAIKATAYKFTNGAAYVGGTSVDKGYGLVDASAAVVYLRANPT